MSDKQGRDKDTVQAAPGDAEVIWQDFFPKLLRVAKRRMGAISTRAVDEEDVALSAIKSYFRGLEAGRFEQIKTADELWNLLVTILGRKITAERRRQLAQKRSGRDARSNSVPSGRNPAGEQFNDVTEVMDNNQLPESTEQVIRVCEDLLLQLPNDKLRQTAILRMEGYTHEEIAQQVGGSVARSKQRVRLIREIWSKLLGETSGE